MSIRQLTSSLAQMLCSSFLLFVITSTVNAQTNGSFGTPVNAHALAATSQLRGTVVDEQDAVVPDAAVVLTDLGGKFRRRLTTDRDGSFVVQLLAPANYTVTVQHLGFVSAEVKNVILKVNDRLALKIQLKVGGVGGTVTVDGTRFLRHTPEIVTSLDGKFVENLPISGKTLQPLVLLTPGAVLTKSIFTEQGQFSVNGQRANANFFLVDGVSANIGVAAGAGLGQSGAGSLPALSVLGTTHSLFSMDSLQEFKIQTSSYSPEFGRTPGAQVLITTRSGTNQFRGSVFEYFRHDALEANDWFANRSLLHARLRHHDFGGVFSGPIVKDRTFLFLSYEGLRSTSPQIATREVPSLAARQTAPSSIKSFLNAFPMPNDKSTNNGLAKFTAAYSDPATVNTAAVRIDAKVNDSFTIFGRYNYAPSAATQRGVASSLNTSLPSSLNTSQHTFFETQTVTAGLTLNRPSGISNDLRINYSRVTASKNYLLDDLGGAIVPGDAVFFPLSVSSHDSMYGFSLGNGSTFFVGKDIDNLQRQVNLVDNLAIAKGTHALKFGVDYRQLFPVYGQRRYNQLANFNGVEGALTGTASSVSIVTQDQVRLVFSNLSAYAQDNWRIRPRLTLSYGVRWELNPSPTGRGGRDLLTALGVDNPSKLALAPLGTPHYHSGYTNFAPRAGLAYQLFQNRGRETIIRAGFGIFYDLGAGMVANSASYFPYLRRKNLANVTYPLDGPSEEPRPFSLKPPFSTVRVFVPNFKLPMTMQWNTSIEQSLGASQALSVSYVGAAGRRLLRSEGIVNPNPNFQQVFVVSNDATSDYHALQIQFQNRLTKHFQAVAAYTWSHSIDINSNDSFSNIPSLQVNPALDRGPSDFDVRHSFSAAVTYDLPTTNLRGISSKLFGNWSLDTMLIARTSTPVEIFSGRDNGYGLFNFRPDRIENVPLYVDDSNAPGGRVVNRAAFAVPKVSRQGTLGRNALRGFPVFQTNFAVRRRLKLTEQINLQLRAEVFNLFNHPIFADPVGDLGSGLFGQAPSTLGRSLGGGGSNGGLSPLYQLGGPRSVQVGMKLEF